MLNTHDNRAVSGPLSSAQLFILLSPTFYLNYTEFLVMVDNLSY